MQDKKYNRLRGKNFLEGNINLRRPEVTIAFKLLKIVTFLCYACNMYLLFGKGGGGG